MGSNMKFLVLLGSSLALLTEGVFSANLPAGDYQGKSGKHGFEIEGDYQGKSGKHGYEPWVEDWTDQRGYWSGKAGKHGYEPEDFQGKSGKHGFDMGWGNIGQHWPPKNWPPKTTKPPVEMACVVSRMHGK